MTADSAYREDIQILLETQGGCVCSAMGPAKVRPLPFSRCSTCKHAAQRDTSMLNIAAAKKAIDVFKFEAPVAHLQPDNYAEAAAWRDTLLLVWGLPQQDLIQGAIQDCAYLLLGSNMF